MPQPLRPMRPPTRRCGTIQLKAKPRESSWTWCGSARATLISVCTLEERSCAGVRLEGSSGAATKALPPAAFVLESQDGNQSSPFKVCTRALSSFTAAATASAVPDTEATWSASRSEAQGSLMETVAPVLSRSSLTFVPPLPMMKPAAERGRRTRKRISPSAPSLSPSAVALAMRTVSSMTRSMCSSSPVCAVRMRQSVFGK
mmetsp:Transcript_105548/g.293867  ORF Transcript_105548/g.293867 Transcript_105548/m.293867 type:complete len:202 (+) Transcript_105548:216-821(+)